MTRHAAPHAVDGAPVTGEQVAVAEPATWIAMGTGVFSGVLAFGALVIVDSNVLADDSPHWDTWNASGVRLWLAAFLYCFLPMLVAALMTLVASMRQTTGPRGLVRHRLRQVAGAVTLLGAFFLLLGLGVVDSETRDYGQRNAPQILPLLLLAGATVATAASLAWSVARLILAATNWQPPAHLVRRPPAAARR